MTPIPSFVIPAKAGIHLPRHPLPQGSEMDSRLRGNDRFQGADVI